MRALAIAMWEAKSASKPYGVAVGAWHLPFASLSDEGVRVEDDPVVRALAKTRDVPVIDICKMVSAARVARVSYEDFETGKRSTPDRDVALCDRLILQGHWSPFEHQATPDVYRQNVVHDNWFWEHGDEHGNFTGWRQWRKQLPGEAVRPIPEEFR
jgi:hypothetical protein